MPRIRFPNLFTEPFRLEWNIAANVVSNLVVAAAFIVSVPLVLSYIGVEAYGLVGLFLAMQGIVAVLDIGLNVTITREFAVKSKDAERAPELGSLLKTSEIVYWIMAGIAAVVWLPLAGFASSYVNPQDLSGDTVFRCILIMGIPLALQFPISLYSASLYGLQRQVLVSLINAGFAVARYVGVLATLHFVSQAPEAYFSWTAVLIGLHVPVLAVALRSSMPAERFRSEFDLSILTRQWKFVGAIGMVTIVSVLLLQTDKLVLARIFSLDVFGYYAIAATLAGGLQWLIQPIFRAIFPKLSQITELGDRDTVSKIYHKGCQAMAVIVLPVSTLCAYFSRELLFLWQGSDEIAAKTYVSFGLLISGGALNALLFVPYALQLAHGSTRLQLITLAAGLAAFIPMTITFASHWGPPGAAAAWVLLNLAFLATVVPLTHRRFLPGETKRWAIADVLMPLVAAVVSGGFVRIAYRETDSSLLSFVQLSAAFVVISFSCVLASDIARDRLLFHSRRLTKYLSI